MVFNYEKAIGYLDRITYSLTVIVLFKNLLWERWPKWWFYDNNVEKWHSWCKEEWGKKVIGRNISLKVGWTATNHFLEPPHLITAEWRWDTGMRKHAVWIYYLLWLCPSLLQITCFWKVNRGWIQALLYIWIAHGRCRIQKESILWAKDDQCSLCFKEKLP